MKSSKSSRNFEDFDSIKKLKFNENLLQKASAAVDLIS
jgi:hypothetical protein